MNIFILENTIVGCAQSMCDKHVVKMMLEYVQLLSTTLHLVEKVDAPYKPTHVNHPCAKWARETGENYSWLWQLADETGKEYTRRYNKQHKSHSVMLDKIPSFISLKGELTPFPNCTPYKDLPVIEAYRKYYNVDKSYFAKWKLGNTPKWFNNEVLDTKEQK
jgi:hypothetical protein